MISVIDGPATDLRGDINTCLIQINGTVFVESEGNMGNWFPIEVPDTGVIWREASSLNEKVLFDLKEKIEAYTPNANLNVNRLNILLVGQTGAGKSSFINTIHSTFRNRVTQMCIAGSCKATNRTVTTTYRQHVIEATKTGRSLNFTLCDIYGLQDEPNVDNSDLTFVLEGHVPDRYKFRHSKPITPNEPGYKATPECKDKMHCVVIVCDATTIEEFSQYCRNEVLALIERLNAEDVPRAVVLTKIDQLSKCLDHDVSTVFRNRKVANAVKVAADQFGVPQSYIHPVKNYDKETCLKNEISCLALMALHHILSYADDFVRNNRPNN